jgi:PAS domain S-box-containing protein
MHPSWETVLTDIALVGGAITAMAASIAAVYKFHCRVVMPFVEAIKGIWESLQQITGLIPDIQKVIARFSIFGDAIERIEHGLVQNRAIGRIILSTQKTAYFETDAVGSCVWVNPAYMELTGLTQEECMGHGWLNAIAFEERDTVAREWAAAIRAGKTFIGTYKYCNVITDREFYIKCKTTFAKDTNGTIVGSLGAVTYASDAAELEALSA